MVDSRRKGYRTEYEIVKRLRDCGINTKRVPLSGGAPDFSGDILLKIGEKEYRCEVKARKDGFKQIYKWLEERDILIIKADRKEYLILVPFEIFINLIGGKKK